MGRGSTYTAQGQGYGVVRDWQSPLFSGQLGGWDARVSMGVRQGWLRRRQQVAAADTFFEGSRHPDCISSAEEEERAKSSASAPGDFSWEVP